jgi:hypothetical protein
VVGVLAEHAQEVALARDQEPVQTLAAGGAHPALRERVRAGRPHRRTNDPHAVADEHGVEGGHELRVSTEDEDAWPGTSGLQLPEHVTRLLRHPGRRRSRRAAGDDHPARLHLQGAQGVLDLSFYRSGLRLTLRAGRLAAAEDWPDGAVGPAAAHFPRLTFIQLRFGYRSLADLEYAFPDCRARPGATRIVLEALFPRRPSLIWSVT